MAEISVDDLNQLYSKSIVMYKDSPVYVDYVTEDREVKVIQILSGKKSTVAFNAQNFKPSVGRIGFINHNGYAFYAVRQPVRRYSVGLTKNNISLSEINIRNDECHNAHRQVYNLTAKGWHTSLLNEYPALQEAIAIARDSLGSCAFDKQFAVDYDRRIFFKKQCVGRIPPRMSSVKRIVFTPGFEHLEILLTNHYEKTIRTFESN